MSVGFDDSNTKNCTTESSGHNERVVSSLDAYLGFRFQWNATLHNNMVSVSVVDKSTFDFVIL